MNLIVDDLLIYYVLRAVFACLDFLHFSLEIKQTCHLSKAPKGTQIFPYPPNLENKFIYELLTCVPSFVAKRFKKLKLLEIY